jgi:hypothetical protein
MTDHVPPTGSPTDEPHVTIEMGGPNIVIRSTSSIDRAYTTSLVEALNAASDSDVTVVLDPEPIRCDDDVAAYEHHQPPPCVASRDCRPAPVDIAGRAVIRVPAESSTWLIDVATGRFCQVDGRIDPRFIAREQWKPVVAVCLTPTRLIAVTPRRGLVSANRVFLPRKRELVGAR